MFVVRLLVRPFSLFMTQYFGLKKMVIFGSFFYAGSFLILANVNGISIWLLIFLLYHALADTFYWLPYHAYYAANGDHEHRGKQISVREVMVLTLTAFSPLIGGIAGYNNNFMIAYMIGAASMFASVIPLLFTKDQQPGTIITHRTALKSIDKRSIYILLGDSINWNFHGFLWPVVLLSLVQNYVQFGGIFVFQILFSAILFLFIGNTIDKGNSLTIVKIAISLNILLVLGRSFYVATIPDILVFESLVALTTCFYSPVFNTVWYNLAKKSPNTLWFHYLSEIGWDIGGFLALSTAGVWVYYGFNIRYVMPLSLIGIYILWKNLSGYCREEKGGL